MEAESEMWNWVKGQNALCTKKFYVWWIKVLSTFKLTCLIKYENKLRAYVTNLSIFTWFKVCRY